MARKPPKTNKSRDDRGSAKSSGQPESTRKSAAREKQTPENQPKLTAAQSRAAEFRVAWFRETAEAVVVAFILALLFRAFLAEVFVIPTGSMAPALMGAHKDLFCDRCECNFQVGASCENSSSGRVVVAGVCPNCRHVNSLDLASKANHATFSGDRILVNKFSYVFNDPKRWDVIVFKFPGNPKQNYIKRLVGLPGETLTIEHGDVYRRNLGSNDPVEILRKPPEKLMAMSQLVHDTNHQADELIAAEYPSRWQPWDSGAGQPPSDSWQITRTTDALTASVDATAGQRWLRYFHHFPGDREWKIAANGGSLAQVDPYASQAITDFYPYNSYVHVPPSSVYDVAQRRGLGGNSSSRKFLRFNPSYQSGGPVDQFRGAAEWGAGDGGQLELGRHGLHWVGDLICTADVQTGSDAKELVMELVEAGVRFECRIDLTSGQAKLSILDGKPLTFDSEGGGQGAANLHPVASTPVRAGRSHQIRLSNCDDQLVLWVDGSVQTFDQPTTYDSRRFRTSSASRPHVSAAHPLDAAPVGIAVTGGKATIDHIELRRDKYYIATSGGNGQLIADYNFGRIGSTTGSRGRIERVRRTLGSPDLWADSPVWTARRSVDFDLDEDQFFPMGDNSPQSLDARCWVDSNLDKWRTRIPSQSDKQAYKWADKSYVPRQLLVGRAILVFWPHYWNAPIKFTPNFKRMKLIE